MKKTKAKTSRPKPRFPKFPKVVYVQEGSGDTFLWDKLEQLVGHDGEMVGVYELKAVKKISVATTLE